MNRFDRLTGIVMLLQAKPWTAQQLADRFEISRRTILRDIDALSQLRVPIVAIPGHHGGYSLPADYSLPPVHFTDDETMVLLLALRRFGPEPETKLTSAARSATDKLNAVLPDHVRDTAESRLRHLSISDRIEALDDEVLTAMRRATASAAWVTFTHERDSRVRQRHLLPLEVQLADDRWYVRGVDADRRAERVFRLARVSDIRPLAPPPDAAAILHDAAAEARAYHADHHPLVHLSLTPAGVALATDHPDFRHHLIDDRVTFRCPPAELPYYAREVLAFGTEVTVVGDQVFIAAMRDRIRAIARHHDLR